MYKNLKEFARSKSFHGILIGLCVAIIILLIFQAGVAVGHRKAAFAYKFGDNYYRAFDERGLRAPFMIGLRGGLPDAHGAAGAIISLTLPTFVVGGPDNIEKVVMVRDDTIIRRFDGEIQPTDLTVDDFVVVLGEPNEDSQIEAKLIRVLPPPEAGNGMRIKMRR